MKPKHSELASVLKTGIFNEPYTSFKDLEKKISELGTINTLAIGNAFEVVSPRRSQTLSQLGLARGPSGIAN